MSLATVDPLLSELPTAQLQARVTGRVVLAGEPDYDALVSPWNLAVSVRPAVVLAARTAQDVVEAVRFARRHRLLVTPQATGHGPIASFVGELLVTTAGLDEVTIHPEGWARVGAGVKWIRVVEAATPYGLAPLSGSITDVGVVGYTTGGGLGPMARTHGLAIDKVRAIEVVTGDGELRRVTPSTDPELFFALRGGKGMLGIITAIEFDLVHQPTFYGGSLWFNGEHAEQVIRAWRIWSEELPELGTTSFGLFRLPAMEGVPPQLAERLTLSIRYVWTGDDADGERWFDIMRTAGPVLLDDVSARPYAEIDAVHTDPLDPMPSHEVAEVLRALPMEAIDTLLALTGPDSTSPQLLVEVRQLGGAFTRGGPHPDAFCARDGAFHLLVVGIPDIPGTFDHAAEVIRAMAPWTSPHRMPNFTFEAADYPDAYDEATTQRLRAAISANDPDGVIAIGHALSV